MCPHVCACIHMITFVTIRMHHGMCMEVREQLVEIHYILFYYMGPED